MLLANKNLYHKDMKDEKQLFDSLIENKSPEFFCDNCGHYPIEPVHGHFMCPECKMPTKCCEGIPQGK